MRRPSTGLVAFCGIIGNRRRRTGGILGIVAGNHAQHRSRVAHVGGEGPNAVKRRSKGDQPVARNAALGRQNAHDAAKAGGLADRAAGVGAQCCNSHVGRHRRRRSAARSARNPLRIHWVAHRPIGRILVRRAHRKLIAVQLAQQHRAGRLKPRTTAVASYGGRYPSRIFDPAVAGRPA